jgi:hypothetical protein
LFFSIQRQQQKQQDELANDLTTAATTTATTTAGPGVTNISKGVSVLLPSSPLPLSKVVTSSLKPMTSQSRDKPDLESLLSNLSPKLLAAQASNSRVMAQLVSMLINFFVHR